MLESLEWSGMPHDALDEEALALDGGSAVSELTALLPDDSDDLHALLMAAATSEPVAGTEETCTQAAKEVSSSSVPQSEDIEWSDYDLDALLLAVDNEDGSSNQMLVANAAADTQLETDDEEVADELDVLQKEREYLEARANQLRRRRQRREERRRAIVADLHKASATQKALVDVAVKQRRALEHIQGMLALAPVNDLRLTLTSPLECYIHLGKDVDERRQAILHLRKDKLEMTRKYLNNKARGLDLTRPYQYMDSFESGGSAYTAYFTVIKYDNAVIQDVLDAHFRFTLCQSDTLGELLECRSSRVPYDGLFNHFMHHGVTARLNNHDAILGREPTLESNSIFFSDVDSHTTVMAMDYANEDDLFPYRPSERIRQDLSTGAMVTAVVDADGTPAVVLKQFVFSRCHLDDVDVEPRNLHKLVEFMPQLHRHMNHFVDRQMAELAHRRQCLSPSA